MKLDSGNARWLFRLRGFSRMNHTHWLRLHGVRQKNVSLALPHDRVTVVTGVSGSGKSSLAFDTLFAEGQWRFIRVALELRADVPRAHRPA